MTIFLPFLALAVTLIAGVSANYWTYKAIVMYDYEAAAIIAWVAFIISALATILATSTPMPGGL